MSPVSGFNVTDDRRRRYLTASQPKYAAKNLRKGESELSEMKCKWYDSTYCTQVIVDSKYIAYRHCF